VEGVEERISVVFGLLELYLSYLHLNNMYNANTNLQLLVGEYGYFLVPLAVPNKNRRRRYQVLK
jgi:hypothetical protein